MDETAIGFIESVGTTMLVGVVTAALGVALIFLPRRPTRNPVTETEENVLASRRESAITQVTSRSNSETQRSPQ